MVRKLEWGPRWKEKGSLKGEERNKNKTDLEQERKGKGRAEETGVGSRGGV